MNWKPIISRMQQMYDNCLMELDESTPKVVRKVLNSARRRRLELGGFQSSLDPGRKALDVAGIIYVVVNTKSKKLYVGQSVNNASHRFKQHYRAAFNDKARDLKMYPIWRKYGIDHIYIFPLQRVEIERDWWELDYKARQALFQNRAYPIEYDWIRRLRTWMPYGYNVQFGGKQKRCRHAKRNPMAKNRNNDQQLRAWVSGALHLPTCGKDTHARYGALGSLWASGFKVQ